MTEEEKLAEKRSKDTLRMRAWRAANPGRDATEQRKRASENPDRIRGYKLKFHYGITQDDYDSMLEAQNSSCAICGAPEPGGKGCFHVDHCHSSGKVRGLLCSKCNTGLGLFRDNPAFLQSAIGYLNA